MSFFDVFWTETLRGAMPWAAPFFFAVTQLGSANFYVAIIAVGYWTMDKKSFRRAALLLLASARSGHDSPVRALPRSPLGNLLDAGDPICPERDHRTLRLAVCIHAF